MRGIPETFVIDRSGRIVDRIIGRVDTAALSNEISRCCRDPSERGGGTARDRSGVRRAGLAAPGCRAARAGRGRGHAGLVAVRGHSAGARAQQVQQIAAGLHCPICKDLSVADSPAPLAQQMRQQIAQQLAAGRSPDEIRAGFVAAYGDSVLMSPPRHGLGRAPRTTCRCPGAAGGALVARGCCCAAGCARPGPDRRRGRRAPLSAAQRQAVRRAVERLREEEA